VLTHALSPSPRSKDPWRRRVFTGALTGWMRVQVMGDTALRPMFYGPSCTLCQDTATWLVMQKMLD